MSTNNYNYVGYRRSRSKVQSRCTLGGALRRKANVGVLWGYFGGAFKISVVYVAYFRDTSVILWGCFGGIFGTFGILWGYFGDTVDTCGVSFYTLGGTLGVLWGCIVAGDGPHPIYPQSIKQARPSILQYAKVSQNYSKHIPKYPHSTPKYSQRTPKAPPT